MTENDEQEPTLVGPRIAFGTLLRDRRVAAGLRQRDLAVKLGWSISKISMVERGERSADENFAREADLVLLSGSVLMDSWRETTAQAARWPTWLARLAEIEQAAHMLRTWQPLIVPGLLQTEGYARAIFSGRPGITPDLLEASVAARLERQHVLEREDGPLLWAVLDEGVLTRLIGSEKLMAEQMARLAATAEHPRINVRVLPKDSCLSTGLQGAFILASGQDMPDMAYIESVMLNQITADAAHVQDLKFRYEMIHGDALSGRASLQLIREMEARWK